MRLEDLLNQTANNRYFPHTRKQIADKVKSQASTPRRDGVTFSQNIKKHTHIQGPTAGQNQGQASNPLRDFMSFFTNHHTPTQNPTTNQTQGQSLTPHQNPASTRPQFSINFREECLNIKTSLPQVRLVSYVDSAREGNSAGEGYVNTILPNNAHLERLRWINENHHIIKAALDDLWNYPPPATHLDPISQVMTSSSGISSAMSKNDLEYLNSRVEANTARRINDFVYVTHHSIVIDLAYSLSMFMSGRTYIPDVAPEPEAAPELNAKPEQEETPGPGVAPELGTTPEPEPEKLEQSDQGNTALHCQDEDDQGENEHNGKAEHPDKTAQQPGKGSGKQQDEGDQGENEQ